jgi:excisionase family DNA binding protein
MNDPNLTLAMEDEERTGSLPDPQRDELLLTIEEAARVLRIGRTKMCSLLASGAVKSVCIGRLRRVPVECVHEYVASLLAQSRPTNRAA